MGDFIDKLVGDFGDAYSAASGNTLVSDLGGSGKEYNHNEALYDWMRNETSAQNARNFSHDEAELAREWEKMMSDTAMQRSVADYMAAGFSPLAALQGGGASSPAAPAVQTAYGSGSKASGASSEVLMKIVQGITNSLTSAAKAASVAAA